MKKEKQQALTNEELASFCVQMSLLIKAGIVPTEAFRILSSDTTDAGSKKLLEDLIECINSGHNVSESLEIVGVFPHYMHKTIKLGEETGQLDNVFTSLGEYYDRECQISETIKSAVTYPALMIIMMFIVIIILITKVLPIFNNVFIQLGSEMTGVAATLMNIGESLSRYSIVFAVILFLMIVAYLFFSKTSTGRASFKKLMSKTFIAKKFNENIALGRFASGIAITFSTGLDIFSGLELVKELVENEKIQAKIEQFKLYLAEGNGFPEGIKEFGFFSNVNARMVDVGFTSGKVDVVMKRIADEYEKKSEKKINDIISVIEPTLVIVLSLIVGLILMSVIMPLMGIMSTIG